MMKKSGLHRGSTKIGTVRTEFGTRPLWLNKRFALVWYRGYPPRGNKRFRWIFFEPHRDVTIICLPGMRKPEGVGLYFEIDKLSESGFKSKFEILEELVEEKKIELRIPVERIKTIVYAERLGR